MSEPTPAGIDPGVWSALTTQCPEIGDTSALEALYGRPFEEDLARLVEHEVPEPIGPSPHVVVRADNTFEALMLRAQETGDTIAMLLPLTGTIYVRKVWAGDLLVHVTGDLDRPLLPFVGPTTVP